MADSHIQTNDRNGIHTFFSKYTFVLLLGYAFLGRGFAYLGIPPVFVGEIGFALAIWVLFTCVVVPVWEQRIVLLLIAFMLWCFFNTVPYIDRYGLNALRDGAQWGYGIFAIAVAVAAVKANFIDRVITNYARCAKVFLIWIIPTFLIFQLAYSYLPKMPWGPGTGVPILNVKPGDIAVHLLGIIALSALALDQGKLRGHIWQWACAGAIVLVGSASRSAFLSLLIPLLVLAFLMPRSGWYRPAFAMLVAFAALVVFDLQIDIGRPDRPLSADTILEGFWSVFGATHSADFGGTKEWRLLWWDKIVGYTFFGDYFWTGKGFGVNLANADGFQVYWDSSLRSPHNSHLTILARAGVPGFLLWVLLQASFAYALFRAYLVDASLGLDRWAAISLWILLYWLAFMINGSFDVFLEGPHGGIWFWSLMGLGIAHLVQRRLVTVSAH